VQGAAITVDKYLLICASAFAMVGAFHDLRSRRIPNRLTLGAIAAGLVVRGASGGWLGLASAAAGAAIAGGFLFLFFLAGGLGGGDVKLMAAVGAWAGAAQVIPILLAAAIAGGVLAVFAIIAGGRTLRNTAALLRHHFTFGLQRHPQINVQYSNSARVPFGIAIALGALFCAGSTFLRR
jgi:prepilin peptidase CpaA